MSARSAAYAPLLLSTIRVVVFLERSVQAFAILVVLLMAAAVVFLPAPDAPRPVPRLGGCSGVCA